MTEPSLDIIIVNWNAGPRLRDCLASLAGTRRGDLQLERVVVVDNASVDHSLEGLESLALPVLVIRNGQNRGFAAACNQGGNGSRADYLLFLNPDTRLRAESLIQPIAFMERPQNRRIGIVGIQLLDEDGQVARTCARFPTPGRLLASILGLDRALPRLFPPHFMVEWDHQQSRQVDQVMGAYFLVRRSAFEALGGFDERFFVYFEEVDLSKRAQAQGWHTFYMSDVQAYHRGGGRGTGKEPASRLFYSLRSRILYAYKHFNRWSATVLMVGTLFVEPISRVVIAIVRRSPSQLADTVKAYARLWQAVSRGLRIARPADRV